MIIVKLHDLLSNYNIFIQCDNDSFHLIYKYLYSEIIINGLFSDHF